MEQVQERIRANPAFNEFVRKRNAYSIWMTVIGAFAYYGFILLVAYDKEFLAAKVSPGGVMSVGIPIGVGVIVFTIALTWIYVRRANGEFDETSHRIVEEARK